MPAAGIRRAALLSLIAATSILATLASAMTLTEVIKSRQGQLRELGTAYKNLKDAVRSRSPQMIMVEMSAEQIRKLAEAQYGWFPAGSGPEAGVETGARNDIWSQPDEFRALQDRLVGEADALLRAVATRDTSAIRAQTKSVGRACGACHKKFRNKDDD